MRLKNEMCGCNVDGAYGAAATLCDRGKALLRGIELADSLSLDPHKWLFQSLECGCVLLRDSGLLKAAYRIMPEYLADVHRNVAEVNPCDYGIQLTRSFPALKLMDIRRPTSASMHFAPAMERGFELAEFAEQKLRTMPGWEIVTPAQMGIVTFHHPDADYEKLHDAMLAEGFALATSTVLKGRTGAALLHHQPHRVRSRMTSCASTGCSTNAGIAPCGAVESVSYNQPPLRQTRDRKTVVYCTVVWPHSHVEMATDGLPGDECDLAGHYPGQEDFRIAVRALPRPDRDRRTRAPSLQRPKLTHAPDDEALWEVCLQWDCSAGDARRLAVERAGGCFRRRIC